MSTASQADHRATGTRLPWHAWVLGVLVLAVYLGGAWDYVNLILLNDDYFAAQGWGREAKAYFTDYPVPTRVLWTLNVAAALAAPVLLFARSHWTASVALVSTLAQAVLMTVSFIFMGRLHALGPAVAAFGVGILLLTATFWLYCRWIVRKWKG